VSSCFRTCVPFIVIVGTGFYTLIKRFLLYRITNSDIFYELFPTILSKN
jgi:hypothetical protein